MAALEQDKSRFHFSMHPPSWWQTILMGQKLSNIMKMTNNASEAIDAMLTTLGCVPEVTTHAFYHISKSHT